LKRSEFFGPDPPSQLRHDRHAATKAVTKGNQVVKAHVTLGLIALQYDWDWPNSEQHLKRALELNPSYSVAHEYYG